MAGTATRSSTSRPNKIQAIKGRPRGQRPGLEAARALVDEAAKPLKEGVEREGGDKLKGESEDAGGSVEIT